MPHANLSSLPALQNHRARLALACMAVLGLGIPWVFNIRYFLAGGSVAPEVFFRDALANALTTAITVDVYLAALVFSGAVWWERRVRRPWLHVLACFAIGLAFALPLYLLHRRLPQGQAD